MSAEHERAEYIARRRAGLKAMQDRRDAISKDLQEMEDDVAHWNSLHPNEEPLVADEGGLIGRLIAEIDAKLAVARAEPGILES